MRRRTLLEYAGASMAAALAGCLGGMVGDGNQHGGGDDGADEVSIVAESITTVDASCAGEFEADTPVETDVRISFESGRVALEGALQASTPCHEAVFDGIRLEEGSAGVTLEVTIGLESDADDEFCRSCLGLIEYEAVVAFDGALPAHVRVIHERRDGETETTETSR